MTLADVALGAFTFCNAARVLAYVPQVLRIAHDTEGAKAISSATWLLFAISHVSTISYSTIVVSDPVMAVVFSANAVGCAGIVILTLFKRRRLRRLLREEEPVPHHCRLPQLTPEADQLIALEAPSPNRVRSV